MESKRELEEADRTQSGKSLSRKNKRLKGFTMEFEGDEVLIGGVDIEEGEEKSEEGNAKVDKTLTRQEEGDEMKNGAVDVDEEEKSKEANAKRVKPLRLRELLASGILEGFHVAYGRGASKLKGVIKGTSLLCFCNHCNGIKIVPPTLFEEHAQSAKKRPPENIFLENGHSLRDVMTAWKVASVATLEETINRVVGPNVQNARFCLSCGGFIDKRGEGRVTILCSSCLDPDNAPTRSSLRYPLSRVQVEVSEASRKIERRKFKKDMRLHKIVFTEAGLPVGTEVGYFVGGEKKLSGQIQGSGILCSCCNTVISASLFESHAGFAVRRKPFQNIYIANGLSLHEYSQTLTRGRKFCNDKASVNHDGASENHDDASENHDDTSENQEDDSENHDDDLCSVCENLGDLVSCHTCPRSFHPDCISLPSIGKGDWSCKYCHCLSIGV